MVINSLPFLFLLADLLLKLHQFDAAESKVWELLERNPDCKDYYELFYKIKEARTKSGMKSVEERQFLEKCKERFSSARLPKLLYLETLNGNYSIILAFV